MERSGVASVLGLPGDMPSDCRRGNCLTCSALHSADSVTANLRRGEDGLAPSLSERAATRGFVLTCSSYLSGDGVHLELGENHRVWDEMYRKRLEESEDTQRIAREAVARVMRRGAERNVLEWAKETEEALRKSSDS